MKKTLTYAINVAFIAGITLATFHVIFGDTEWKTIIRDLKMANNFWLIIGLALLLLFVSGESVIIKYMLKLFGEKVTLVQCLKYSFIGFFFSSITPSSSGGQPAQVIYMKKDGIKIGYSSLILLVITVIYKLVLVIFGLALFLFNHTFVVRHVGEFMWLLIVGFVLNIAYISCLVLIIIKPNWARRVGVKILNFLTRIHVLKWKNNEKYINKLDRICENYSMGANYIKTHARAVINIFIITSIQRICFFGITYTVYKSYALSGTSFLKVISISTMIAITAEMLPLPGAAGITEACFIVMFNDIFTEAFVDSAMLLSRGISFYCLLIISGAITIIAHFISMKKHLSAQGVDETEA